MKNYLLFNIGLILVLGLLIAPACFAQTPSYTCTLANDVQTANNVYEFDIYLLRKGATQFELAQIQFGFLYNDAIRNGGTLSVSYVTGSVDASIVSSGQENNDFNTSTAGCIKIAAKLPTGGSGTGAIISNVSPGTRVGRLRLTNSIPFVGTLMNIAWSFSTLPYPSKVFAYVGGINTDITVPGNHINSLANSPLPVELSSFAANVQARNITILWETQTEKNSDRFEVERSLMDDNKWETIGSVKASVLSNSPKQYSYMDKNLQTGTYQYRIKMIDNDGSFEYSKIVESVITLPKNFELNQNYPNPFNPSTKISYSLPNDSRVTLDIFNLIGERIGQLVNQDQAAGYYSVGFSNASVNKSLSSGIYLYRIHAVDKSTGKDFSSIKKMVLLK